MVYQWNKAARIRADAQKAGEVCEMLEQTVGLTAKNLLEASRPEDAPLHSEFEWDDAIAAEAYREEQARYIIRSLCVKPTEEKNEPIRAFFNVSQVKYENIATIVSDSEKKASLLSAALKELQAFRKKYHNLEKLSPVFRAIDIIEKKAG